ncbi:MAG: endonuclease V [Candidatus Hydrogenedentota bacterium]
MDLGSLVFIQKKIAERVKIKRLIRKNINNIGFCDVSYPKNQKKLNAVIAIYNRYTWKIVEKIAVKEKISFPYISGFLSFREAPAIVKAFKRLKIKPDLLVLDGQGLAHPRGCGIATHIGVMLNIPTIGIAKSHLAGSIVPAPLSITKKQRVQRTEIYGLKIRNKQVGWVIYTPSSKHPVYLSIGYLISLFDLLWLWEMMPRKYRLPEPVRETHIYSKAEDRR